MEKNQLQNGKEHARPTQLKESPFGVHPLDAQPGAAVQMRTMAPTNSKSSENVRQHKEQVEPGDIPDAHIGYEYIAKLAYQDAATIQNSTEIGSFLSKFGYSAANIQVIEGVNGLAMLYVPAGNGGKNPPILAFRGTEATQMADLGADIDISYIGEPQFTQNKKIIEGIIAGAGQKIVLLGHSLGGALAQKAAVEFTDMTKEVVTFQAPGLGLGEKVNGKGEDTISSTHHLAEHDLVDRAGFSHTPGDVYVHDSSLNPLSAHTQPVFGTSEFAPQREALGIATPKNADGKEIDSVLGGEIRQQDPDKNHIEKHDSYPGYRKLLGAPLEVLRSAGGLVKGAGELTVGAVKGIGKGIAGIGRGIGKGFQKIGEAFKGSKDEGEQKPKKHRYGPPGKGHR